MLNRFYLFFLLFISYNFSGNSSNLKDNKQQNRTVIDSLKQIIFRDTVKYDEKDIIFTQMGRKNVNSYSMLYIVNGAYIYMLDIIPANKVIEFVNEILDTNKIASIAILPKEKASGLGGEYVQNGIVAIVLKNKTKFNPYVAELTRRNKETGDNFKKNGKKIIMIRRKKPK